MAGMIGLVGCAESAAVIGLIQRLLLQLMVRDADPTFGSLVCWWRRILHAAKIWNRYFYSVLELFICLTPPTIQELTEGQWREGRFKVEFKVGEG